MHEIKLSCTEDVGTKRDISFYTFCMIYLLFLVNSILNVLNLIQSKKKID